MLKCPLKCIYLYCYKKKEINCVEFCVVLFIAGPSIAAVDVRHICTRLFYFRINMSGSGGSCGDWQHRLTPV